MAAIRMLFSWLTEKRSPGHESGPGSQNRAIFADRRQNAAFVEGEVQRLLNAIETSTHTGLRNRALLGVLAYAFARIGAAVNVKVEDYYPSGKRFLLRFKEKGAAKRGYTREDVLSVFKGFFMQIICS